MQIFFIFYFHFSIRRISNHIHLYICTYIYICIWHKKKRKGVAYCYFVLFAGLFVSFSYKRRKEELPLSGWRKLNNWSWHNTQQGVQDLCLNSISRFFGRLLAVYGWEGGKTELKYKYTFLGLKRDLFFRSLHPNVRLCECMYDS